MPSRQRVRTRLALAAAAGLLAAGAVPATAATAPPPPSSAIVVPATGETVTAPLFAAQRGAIVQVHVSGVFAYDTRGGLADCRYHDANAALAAQDWQDGGIGLLVDGAPADCWASVTGAGDQHRYTINLTSTGAPPRFAIADPTGYADNAGGLTVDLVTAIDVDGSCAADGGGGPNFPVAVVAEAHQTGIYATGSYTRIECVVREGEGEYVGTVVSEDFLPATATYAMELAMDTTLVACPTVSVLLADRTVLVEHVLPCTTL